MTLTNNKLQAFVDAILEKEDAKSDIMVDIKDLYAQAKAEGFDNKILRKIVAEAKKDEEKRVQEKETYDLYYENIFGM